MPDLDRVTGGLRCRDLLSLLPDYVDGELGAEAVGRLDAHLRGCVHCVKFGGEYDALVKALRRHATPPTVTSEVRARLAHRMEDLWAREDQRR